MLEPISVSIPEGARLIGCSRSKIYELIAAGELPLVKVGNRSLLIVAELRALVARKSKLAAAIREGA